MLNVGYSNSNAAIISPDALLQAMNYKSKKDHNYRLFDYIIEYLKTEKPKIFDEFLQNKFSIFDKLFKTKATKICEGSLYFI